MFQSGSGNVHLDKNPRGLFHFPFSFSGAPAETQVTWWSGAVSNSGLVQ